MNPILIITYYWPPSGGSGVQRWMYFTKYLRELGHDPIVLTVSEKFATYKYLDPSFLHHVKAIKTYYSATLEPLKLYSLLTTGSVKSGFPHGGINGHKKGLFHQLTNYIRSNFFIPDARVGWNYFAIRKAKKIIKQHNIKLVITTGPPQSTHLIGLKLKKELAIKWLADLRDPWTDVYFNHEYKRTQRAQNKDLSLEYEVLKSADRITTVGIKLKELLMEKVPDSEHKKFYHLYNGFDPSLFDATNKKNYNDSSYFTISHIGSLISTYPNKMLIKSLKESLDFNVNNKKIKLVFAGPKKDSILKNFQNELKNITIEYRGYVSHKESIALMCQSDLLICLFPNKKKIFDTVVSGKLMEYIASGNPILAIANPTSEATLLLKEIPNAKTVSEDNIADAKNFIITTFEKWSEKKPLVSPKNIHLIKSKNRLEVTKKLSQIIKTI